MAAAVRRVFASCSAIVPFSPARIRELPPTATNAVFDITNPYAGGGPKTAREAGLQRQLASIRRTRNYGLAHQVQHGVANNFLLHRFHSPVRHQFQHDRLLGVQSVLCLLEDEGAWRIDHLIGDLIASMGREAVQENSLRFGATEELRVHLIGAEYLLPVSRFRLRSH